jgi:hypothetical protein
VIWVFFADRGDDGMRRRIEFRVHGELELQMELKPTPAPDAL